MDRYFQYEFSETRFRAIYVEMNLNMLFREYYAMSVNLCLLQTDRNLHESMQILNIYLLVLISFNLVRNWYRYSFSEFLELIPFLN
jgi:hypothetical protein